MFRVFLAAVLLVAGAALALSISDAPRASRYSDAELAELFAQFEARYGPVPQAEREMALKHFAANLARAAKLNAAHTRTVYGVTKFSHLSPAQFRARYLLRNGEAVLPDLAHVPTRVGPATALPTSYNLFDTTPPGMLPPQDEGQCGNTWAISAVTSAESVWAVSGGHTLTALSSMQVAACDTQSQGCNGGWPGNALQYIVAHGLESNESYPYHAYNKPCLFNPAKVVARFGGWERATSTRNETQILEAVKHSGAVSVCVDAQKFQLYKSGIIEAQGCGRAIDHCVVVAGWSDLDGKNAAYLIANVWGSDWGIDGNALVQFGANACGIAEFAILPTLQAGPSSGNSANSGNLPHSSSSSGGTSVSSTSGGASSSPYSSTTHGARGH